VFGGPTDAWLATVPVAFDLRASWNSPSFAVALCLKATTNSNNVASLFAVTAELFFVNATGGTSSPTSTTGAVTTAAAGDSRTGAIVGGVLGGLALVALVALLIVCVARKKKQPAQMNEPLLRGVQPSSGSGSAAPTMADMSAWGAQEESVLPPDAGQDEASRISAHL
jgi:hypothetical protein